MSLSIPTNLCGGIVASGLTEDVLARIEALMNFVSLWREKGCGDADIYLQSVEAMLEDLMRHACDLRTLLMPFGECLK